MVIANIIILSSVSFLRWWLFAIIRWQFKKKMRSVLQGVLGYTNWKKHQMFTLSLLFKWFMSPHRCIIFMKMPNLICLMYAMRNGFAILIPFLIVQEVCICISGTLCWSYCLLGLHGNSNSYHSKGSTVSTMCKIAFDSKDNYIVLVQIMIWC